MRTQHTGLDYLGEHISCISFPRLNKCPTTGIPKPVVFYFLSLEECILKILFAAHEKIKEGIVLFNDALNTFSYSYMASDIW